MSVRLDFERHEFRAYKGTELRLHTWARVGHSADMERGIFAKRLSCGDFDRVIEKRPNGEQVVVAKEQKL